MIQWTRRNRSTFILKPVAIALTTVAIFPSSGQATGFKSNWSGPGIQWTSRKNTNVDKAFAISWTSPKVILPTGAIWQSIQDQIDAGYPIFIQPTKLVGTYERVFDFGTILNTLIINLVWNQNQIEGSTSVVSEIAYSTDNITYSSYIAARSLFVSSMRYVKVKFTFTSIDRKSLLEFYNLVINLNVKVETDSGSIIADEDDVSGTVVTFNKTFKDINSITVSADSVTPITVIYDFVDVPNPTSFKVYAFNAAGARVTYLVSWKARGIT
jgi:hypothetical protein